MIPRKQLIFFYPSIEVGGLTKNLFSLINSLSKKNYKINFITFRHLENTEGKKLYAFDKKINVIMPKFKFKTDKNTIFYDVDKNLIEDVKSISKGQRVVAIIKPKYVWINSGKFGVTWVASQICLKGGANDNDFPECVLSDDE